MRRSLMFIAFMVYCIATAGSAWAADYFVSASGGNDANAGTAETAAWKTTAKVQAEALAGRFVPGDRILFKRADRWSMDTTGMHPQLDMGSGFSGDSSNRIIIGSYGICSSNGSCSDPVFDFGSVEQQEAENQPFAYGWRFTDCNYLSLENLSFTGGYGTRQVLALNDDAILLNFKGKTDGIKLSDIAIQNTAIGTAISFEGPSSADPSRDIAIRRCTLNNTLAEKYRRNGFLIGMARDFIIEDCSIAGAGMVGMGFGQSGDGIVRRNSITGGIAWAIAAGMCGQIIIEWNSIIDNGRDAFTRPPFNPDLGGGICQDGPPMVFNPMAIDLTLCFNWIIRHNVVGRQHKLCRNRWETNFVYLEGWCQGNTIYGNVAYEMDGPCYVSGNCSDNYFFNNLCYNNNLGYAEPMHESGDIRLAGGMCDDVQLDETTSLCQEWPSAAGKSCYCPDTRYVNGQYQFQINGTYYPASLLQGKVRLNTVVANNIIVNASVPEDKQDMTIMGIGCYGTGAHKTTSGIFSNNISWALPGKMYRFGTYSRSSFSPLSFDEWNGLMRVDPDTGATVQVTGDLNLDPLIPFDAADSINQDDFIPLPGSPAYDRAEGIYTDGIIGVDAMALMMDASGIQYDVISGFTAMALANNFDGSAGPPDIGPMVNAQSPQDQPPVIGDGPFLAAGTWPVLPTDPAKPINLDKNYNVLWTFSDDFGSCSGACTHSAKYQITGASVWTELTVISDPINGHAYTELPVEALQNDTLYTFQFFLTDCAGQTTESPQYYFKAWYERPPVITSGPFLAAGSWPVLPTDPYHPFFLMQNYNVLWTFSDDFATCTGPCTHSAKYQKTGASDWTDLAVTADPAQGHAYTGLPVETLIRNETYIFQFSVTDCAGQETVSPQYYFAFGIDSDRDGIPDEEDNCPDTCNSQQLDADGDGIGDVCDPSPGCGGCGQPACDPVCAP